MKKEANDAGKKTGVGKNRLEFEHYEEAFSLGPAYLDYCVRKGWLKKTGDDDNPRYDITEKGKKKLGDVQLNFDLSAILSKGDGPKKKQRRHQRRFRITVTVTVAASGRTEPQRREVRSCRRIKIGCNRDNQPDSGHCMTSR